MKKIDFIKLWPLLIFTFAFVIRMIFLTEFEKSPIFYPEVKGVDPSLYHEWAEELASGYWPGEKLLFGHPFYPYIISFLYRFWGVETYAVRFFQFLMGSASCVLLYFIAKSIFNARVAILSSFLTVLYGPFLFYEGLMVPTALSIFLNLGAILMLLNVTDFPNARRTLLAGLLLGCSLAANSAILPFLFMAIVWIGWILRNSKKALIAHLACLFIGILLPTFFLTLKHFSTEGSFNLFGAHGGINFYVGNNSQADGTFRAPAGFTPSAWGLSKDSSDYAQKATGRKMTPEEVSKFWYRLGFEYIKKNPLSWCRLLLRKFILFWNATELGDIGDYYLSKNDSAILKFNPFTFGIIAPFGLVGIFLARKRLAVGFLLYAGLLSYLFSCISFFVNSRYRVPAVPFLLVFAAVTLNRYYERLIQKDSKAILIPSAILAIFFIFVNAKVITADSLTPRYNLTVIYAKKGLYDEAIEESNRLLAHDYDLPYVHFNLGVCLYEKGALEQAIFEFKEAVRFLPRYHEAHFNLGLIYLQGGDYEDALDEFNILLSIDRNDIAAIYNIGRIYQAQGLYQDALNQYKKALKLSPDLIEVKTAYRNLKEKMDGQK